MAEIASKALGSFQTMRKFAKSTFVARRAAAPKSGADLCRHRARACRERAADIADVDTIRQLLALAPQWDRLALEMEGAGVSAADLAHSRLLPV